MKIAIIDDERPARSELQHLILSALPEAEIHQADSGKSGLDLVINNGFDLLFIDIHLGDMDGTTLSALIHKVEPEIKIVFATAFDQYAVKAFDLNAVDYLLKPFEEKRVAQALEKCQTLLNTSSFGCALPLKNTDKLSVSIDKTILLLDIKEIVYIETGCRCCMIHTKSEALKTQQTLASLEEKLVENGFFRIHKSYLVNLQFITEISPWIQGSSCVKLLGIDDLVLPVSRSQIKSLKQIFHF